MGKKRERNTETDNKATEEKALNYFKSFIEDSKVISQYLDDNDKEPCWDGHLYLYSDGERDKEHLIGRVPVQIKGTEVKHFVTKKWKFKLFKNDLKAYLDEPTFFIVCQVKKDSKERKLFFRELLPGLVNRLLKDMGKNESRMTLFHALTEDLTEFEDQLQVFMSNSKRMISFAHTNPLSMEDAIKRGIKEYSFIAPEKFSNILKLLKYLSTHQTHLYAKLSKDLNIDIPISDGPARFEFKRQDDGDIKVGDRAFFKGYTSEIKNGRLVLTIDNVMTIDLPIDETDKVKPVVKMTPKAKYLKEAINEAEFAIALNKTGVLSVGSVDLQMLVNEKDFVKDMEERLVSWKEWESVLDKLHVTKPFDLTGITKEQEYLINLLIETIGKGKTVKIPGQKSTLLVADISNVKLLLWCAVDKNGNCFIGDFFDKTIKLSYRVSDKETISVSPFSYLQNERYWESIDNIDYESLVESAKKAVDENEYCYHMSNYDVLAMIKAADALENTAPERINKLLEKAKELDEWLIAADKQQGMTPVHVVNKMQILKRQRGLKDDEKHELEEMLNSSEMDDAVKVSICLLLERNEEADELFTILSDDDKKRIKEFPIWRYYKKA